MTMRRILATAAALCLGGCITVYGPVKTGGQQQQDSQSGQQPGMSEQISTSFIGNRKPDELLNAVALYFREKAITASVNDQTTGIIAGIDAEIVYKRSKKHGIFRVLPVKGASVYGKPVITMPKKRNQSGVFLCEIGTDTAKEMLYARMGAVTAPADEATPYAIRFPDNPDVFTEVEAKQLVAEELVEKLVNGKFRLLWDAKGRRNEALDCLVYASSALRVSVQRWQLDLEALAMFAPEYNIEIHNDAGNGQIGPQALQAVYNIGKKAAIDFWQQQSRDGGIAGGGR